MKLDIGTWQRIIMETVIAEPTAWTTSALVRDLACSKPKVYRTVYSLRKNGLIVDRKPCLTDKEPKSFNLDTDRKVFAYLKEHGDTPTTTVVEYLGLTSDQIYHLKARGIFVGGVALHKEKRGQYGHLKFRVWNYLKDNGGSAEISDISAALKYTKQQVSNAIIALARGGYAYKRDRLRPTGAGIESLRIQKEQEKSNRERIKNALQGGLHHSSEK